MSALTSQLAQLSAATRAVLSENHFNQARFLRLAKRLTQPDAGVDNRVSGQVLPPAPGDVVDLAAPGSAQYAEYTRLGDEALREGGCAFVLLAGGMATRMGGVIKALVEAHAGQTFLELRIKEMAALEARFGRRPPLHLMTSYATDRGIRQALGQQLTSDWLATFPQHVSLRLRQDGTLYLDSQGEPSVHAHGHGDFLDAYRESGLLDRFLANGGRTVMVTNLDNLGAWLDPAVLGFHLAHGAACTSEVVDKVGSDRGGIPVRLDGKLLVLEEFRLPEAFDPTQVPVFNVNTFCFDAERLAALDVESTYFTVEKQVDSETVLQFERLINELTFILDTRYLRVPRAGENARFLPVKDHAELKARQAEIRAVLLARGVLETA